MKILGCVVSVLMRQMVAWSLGTLGRAGTSWHVDVVMRALFRSMIVGCVQMWMTVLGMASRGMP
jgi:hypothetical protein